MDVENQVNHPQKEDRSLMILGIISITIGALSFCLAWVPFLGLIAMFSASFAIFIGFVGVIVSLFNKRRDITWVLSGCFIGCLAIATSLYSTMKAAESIVDQISENSIKNMSEGSSMIIEKNGVVTEYVKVNGEIQERTYPGDSDNSYKASFHGEDTNMPFFSINITTDETANVDGSAKSTQAVVEPIDQKTYIAQHMVISAVSYSSFGSNAQFDFQVQNNGNRVVEKMKAIAYIKNQKTGEVFLKKRILVDFTKDGSSGLAQGETWRAKPGYAFEKTDAMSRFLKVEVKIVAVKFKGA